jgi:putative ABC transport system permease protein
LIVENAPGFPVKPMFANYLKVAIRQFYKLPVFSGINIVGLVIGLSSSLLIGLWVYDEATWDSYHEKGDDIYRLPNTFPMSSQSSR